MWGKGDPKLGVLLPTATSMHHGVVLGPPGETPPLCSGQSASSGAGYGSLSFPNTSAR